MSPKTLERFPRRGNLPGAAEIKIVWGSQAAQLGVGPRPKRTAENPAAALSAMKSPEMRRRDADPGASLRAEPDEVRRR